MDMYPADNNSESFEHFSVPPYGEADGSVDGEDLGTDDYGQAVLDGRFADNAEHEVEKADIGASTYAMDADDTPFVQVPGAAELDVHDGLPVAPIAERLAYRYQMQYDRQDPLPDRPTPEDSIDYRACELEHTALDAQYAEAKATLLAAVDGAYKTNAGIFKHYSSRHSGSFMLSSSDVVPVTRVVDLYTHSDGNLFDYFADAALTVRTETGYGSHQVIHNLVSLSTDDRNSIPGTKTFNHRDVWVGLLPTVLNELAEPLRAAAQAEAVEPLVDEYLALPRHDTSSAPDDYGFKDLPPSLKAMLNSTDTDREQVAAVLQEVFKPENHDTLAIALATPIYQIADRMEAAGAADRYEWLLTKAAAIQEQVLAAERRALDIGLRPAYDAWRHEQAAKISEFAQLAEELLAMPAEPFAQRFVRTSDVGRIRAFAIAVREIFKGVE